MADAWTVRPTTHPGTFQVRLDGEFYVQGYMGATNAYCIAAARDLQESCIEVERILRFAFEEGALSEDVIMGLCIDPYGVLADLRAAIAKSKAPAMNVGGRPDQ